ncbi:MAG TPA: TIGR03085 family metal-binding protein [Kineosporiaceae bacterium]
MSSYAAAERAELVAALQAVPPGAPTLCAGWTALDLAAHVVARERRPDSTPGLLVPLLAPWAERVRAGYARTPYPELIQLIADGPPVISLFAIPGVDAVANFVEFLIHTEDVRRAQPGWTPRVLPPAEQDAVWTALRRTGRWAYRRCPVGVVLATPDGRRHSVGAHDPQVTLTGEPAELLLHSSGRGEHARIEVEGPDDAVRRFQAVKLGL